jgi:trypsin-like peptidase
MPLDDQFPRSVVFICASRPNKAGVEEIRPIATGFLVSVPATFDPALSHSYVVTAGHAVRGSERRWVRVRLQSDEPLDLAANDWLVHHSTDVAIATFPGGLPEIKKTFIPQSLFADVADAPHLLGDTVYLVGFLRGVREMGSKLTPMVRSGVLGAKYQPGLAIRLSDQSTMVLNGHLVDCLFYPGFSGSPCFVQYFPEVDNIIRLERRTVLLGVAVAHLLDGRQDELEADLIEDSDAHDGEERKAINSGVGVIVPIEYVRELLDAHVTKERRGETEQRLIASRQREDAGEAELASGPKNDGLE